MRRLELFWCALCKVVTAWPIGPTVHRKSDYKCQACGGAQLKPLRLHAGMETSIPYTTEDE